MGDRKMTVTEAARNFADLINRTYYRGESTILFRSGEAVARIVPVSGCGILGRDFADRWREIAHLDVDDAAEFADSIAEARSRLEMPGSKWD